MQTKILKVTLWGIEVGKVKWEHSQMRGIFSYNPDFVKRGLDIAPLTASIHKGYGKGENVVGVPMRRQNKFTGLPVFIADSLPDAWGKKLMKAWVSEYGTEQRALTPLDFLAYTGKRGMGALEFEPDNSPWNQDMDVNLGNMFRLAEKIFRQKEDVSLLPEEEWDMAALCSLGTSAGGMQPKAIIAQNMDSGIIRSGQILHEGDWKYYLLKFAHPENQWQCEMEMAWYRMAQEAGIQMMPSSLMEFEGRKHFLTERFDRVGGDKVHLQTLGAMNPDADSYEDIMEICDELRLPYKEKEEMFRRMVFNVLAGCTDDHNRNFSFMMSKDGKWHITPAYDLTFTVSIENGYIEGDEHELTVRGKCTDISEKDFLLFALENDIKNASRIIAEVKSAVAHVYDFLVEQGVNDDYAQSIADYLTGGEKRSIAVERRNHRISDVVIYNEGKSIRCKIDGVQQLGRRISLKDQIDIQKTLKNNRPFDFDAFAKELACKYYNKDLDMNANQGKGLKQ